MEAPENRGAPVHMRTGGRKLTGAIGWALREEMASALRIKVVKGSTRPGPDQEGTAGGETFRSLL